MCHHSDGSRLTLPFSPFPFPYSGLCCVVAVFFRAAAAQTAPETLQRAADVEASDGDGSGKQLGPHGQKGQAEEHAVLRRGCFVPKVMFGH